MVSLLTEPSVEFSYIQLAVMEPFMENGLKSGRNLGTLKHCKTKQKAING
jgi:hypothetical protein